MSEWQSVKLPLKCKINVLVRALLNIMPQWEQHIQVDPSANLVIHDMHGATRKAMIRIPKGRSTTGLSWCDLGFIQGADGKWEAIIDKDGTPEKIKNIDMAVAQETSNMRIRAIAQVQGYSIKGDTTVGNSQIIDVDVPVEDQYNLA